MMVRCPYCGKLFYIGYSGNACRCGYNPRNPEKSGIRVDHGILLGVPFDPILQS